MRGTVGLLLLLVGCAAPTESTVAVETVTERVTETVTAAPASGPSGSETFTQTWEGGGQFASEPFELPAGAYTSTWTVGGECSTYFWLGDPVTGNDAEVDLGGADGPHEGELVVYGVEAGTYYLDVIAGDPSRCTWSLTLSRRS